MKNYDYKLPRDKLSPFCINYENDKLVSVKDQYKICILNKNVFKVYCKSNLNNFVAKC